jgi:Co/Zn/Cd efflux system component
MVTKKVKHSIMLLEGILMGASILIIVQALWDRFVMDWSPLRQKILYVAIVVLIINLLIGYINIRGAIKMLMRQLGFK